MAPCYSPTVFATLEEGEGGVGIPPWKMEMEMTCSSLGFTTDDRGEFIALHSSLRGLYMACRPSEGGGDGAVQLFLRALLEEKRIVEFFELRPRVAAVIGRFVGRVASSSSSLRRLARIVLKAFFFPEEW